MRYLSFLLLFFLAGCGAEINKWVTFEIEVVNTGDVFSGNACISTSSQEHSEILLKYLGYEEAYGWDGQYTLLTYCTPEDVDPPYASLEAHSLR
jgi:hypothetical protein